MKSSATPLILVFLFLGNALQAQRPDPGKSPVRNPDQQQVVPSSNAPSTTQGAMRIPVAPPEEGRTGSTSGMVVEAERSSAPSTTARPLVRTRWAVLKDDQREGLPYYHESRRLPVGTTAFSVQLVDPVWEEVPDDELEHLPGLVGTWTAPEVRSSLGMYRKVPVALVDIYPYRTSPGTGKWERLRSYDLAFAEARLGGGVGRPKSNDYPAHSKLATGEWYRVQIVTSGMYKVTYEQLQEMGLTGPVASDQIDLFGNHFGLLPFQNSIWRPTDLVTNAIDVQDGGDGEFGPGDQLVFYASGPQRWDLDAGSGLFRHTKHVYTDTASYFIGIAVEAARRVTDLPEVTDAPTRTSDSWDDRQFIEHDFVNVLKSGREMYGETFDATLTYSFNFSTPNLRSQDTTHLVVSVMGRTLGAGVSSSFSISAGGGFNTSLSVPGVCSNYLCSYGTNVTTTYAFNASGPNVPIVLTFNKYDPATSLGYLNYLELNCRRDLKMSGDQMLFRDLRSVGPGAITEFTMDQMSSSVRVWDITDPTDAHQVVLTGSGTQRSFRLHTDSLREFVAFKNSGLSTPISVGRVDPQDLHGTPLPTDLVIVAPPQFLPAAQRLASRRMSEGLVVDVVTPQQVFNEFSSGMRDATAIKRFMKMLYDRAGTDSTLIPRYLLLFGDGSYNNLSLSPGNQNLVPSYQSANSLNPSSSYCSDDYFGLLDDNEGESTADLMDIGVGRFPVVSVSQAEEVVDKVLNYDKFTLVGSSDQQQCSAAGDGGANDWRNWAVFVSDDQEGEGPEGPVHMSQSEILEGIALSGHPCMNISKIYLDAYQQYSTPGGERYPDASADIKDRVQKGALLVNYVGHGGEVGWAHERVLDNSMVLGWTNKDRLPVFVTATCEFSRWDDPARTSSGEYVLLNPEGGGVALMSTTRIAYSNQNLTLASAFYDHIFSASDEAGHAERIGDVSRQTKRDVASGNTVNHRSFVLLGDPSMRLALPREEAVITSVTDTLGNPVDTLMALSTVRISGEVRDGNGQVLTDFNGVVVPTVFDKSTQVYTLANDPPADPYPYMVRKNFIYRGKASVVNGQFTFTFVVPKDIAYQVGPGRISCYAESMATNACGYSDDPLVGGTATDVAQDEEGPRLSVYMNDERFVRGGVTNEDPLLLVKLFDENGINTLGSSIGHDLVAVLDNNTDQAIVLNDLYESDLDTYKSGRVRYRMNDLSEGTHTLSVKAWDVFNNSSEAGTDFVVAPSADLALDHVLNYPNPFTTHTEFYFEHNQPCVTLEVQVQVFTVSGRLVKTLNRRLDCDGFRTEPMAWDGRDDFGDKLGRGVYVYRVDVATTDGRKADKLEKLVILR
ncbi:MAG: type IX secretion system sortase PorU [Flavobacteriales bacterium]|nr:type IX secretion system sortase PorU [Flavobacteriales bacterium]